jgi:hypothetical protein
VQTDGRLVPDPIEGSARDSGELLRCASCDETVTSGAAARCPECRTLYHVPCWNARSGCVTTGCRGYRPVLNRGPLTLLSNCAVEVVPSRSTFGSTSVAVKMPSPQVELLPRAGHVERVRERRRPGWVVTVAIAVAALAVGIAATLVVRHTADGTRQQKGYRSGWQAGYSSGSSGAFDSGFKKGNQAGWDAGYQRGFQEGCHASRGADANCNSSIIPAGTGPKTSEADRRAS